MTAREEELTAREMLEKPELLARRLKEREGTSEFHRSEMLGYLVSKFDRFIGEPTTRNDMVEVSKAMLRASFTNLLMASFVYRTASGAPAARRAANRMAASSRSAAGTT